MSSARRWALLAIVGDIHRIEGGQAQQSTAHQLFCFGIPVSKFAGGLVVNHLIKVSKRDHQQRPLAHVSAAGFEMVISPGLLGMLIAVEEHLNLPALWTEEPDIGVVEEKAQPESDVKRVSAKSTTYFIMQKSCVFRLYAILITVSP